MNKLKGTIYELILWLVVCMPRKASSAKKILIIRVDEIGDYILWRRFLKEMITSPKYREYEFHFCGNQSWKSLFLQFDQEGISHVFWMDKIRFKKDMKYRFRFLKQVYAQGYAIVINPAFSRDKRNDDSIVKAAKARERIGMVANQESIRSYETGYDRHLYTQLFDLAEKPVFEFTRNKRFCEFVTGEPSFVQNTAIPASQLTAFSEKLPEQYFVVFPGSRSRARIWPTDRFIQTSQYLFEQYGWTAVVCGTHSDAAYTAAFCAGYPFPVTDLTGKTSLSQMLSVLQNAKCLLSVDTGSVHLAAAVGCPVFGIFNGSQYRRFAPYPKEIFPDFYAIYPDDVELALQNEQIVKEKYEFVVRVPYASVKAEKVILAIHTHFNR